MTPLLHPDELIRRLRLERRRCFVVTGRHGEGKTHLAQQMAVRYQGRYLSLLETFVADPALAQEVDTFTPQRLKALLQELAGNGLLLLDEIDFLWYTWGEDQKREFLNILKLWDRSAFIGAFLVPDRVSDAFEMLDQDRRQRLISIHELAAIIG